MFLLTHACNLLTMTTIASSEWLSTSTLTMQPPALLTNVSLASTTTAAFVVNSTTTQSNVDLQPDLRVHHPALAVVLAMICVIAVLGNMLTMVAIYRERYLHTATNYFVASLAAADFLIGAIVMPFSVVHEVMDRWWIFGQNW